MPKDAKKTVLLVEDDEILLRALFLLFHKGEYTIASASDGEIALKMTERLKPDLVLLDLLMPKMNGFDYLKSIKANTILKDIPVIVLSNLGDKDDIEKVGLNSMVKLQNNNFISKIKTESFAAARKLWDNSIYIDSINMSNLIKHELSQLYTEQIQLIRDVYAFFNVSSPAVSLAIEKRLEELTKQAKISDDGLNKLKTKSLIAQENFLEKEENDLKKIVAKINENQTLREIFLNTTDKELIIILARDYAEYDNLITLHAKKYDFLQGYVDFNKFDKKYYLYRLKKILSNEQTKNNQLLDELSHWLNLTHYFSNHRMEMRIYYTKGLVSLKKILDEIAKRMNIGVEDANIY